MDKRFWIAGTVASILFFVLGFIVHGIVLESEYMNYKQLFRTQEEAMANMPWMTLAHIIMGFAFAWIYGKGVDAGASWAAQGVRFGIAVMLLVTVPWYLIYYSIQPFAFSLTAKQILLDGLSLVITSLAVAYVYKRSTAMS